jgi:ribonuclease D
MLQREERSKRRIILTEKGFDFIKHKELEFFKPAETKSSYESNLELYNLLREARNEASKRFQQPENMVCPDEVLKSISELRPDKASDLLKIKGFTQRTFNKLGEELLFVIKEFLKTENKQEEQIDKGKNLPANISETFNLIKKGYKISDIASLRKLTEAVISMQVETLLEYYPETDVKYMFDEEDFNRIIEEIKLGNTGLKDLKSRLPEHIGYPFLRIALAKYKTMK